MPIRTLTAARAQLLRGPRLGGDSNRIGLALLGAALVVFFQLKAGGFATTNNATTILLNAFPLLIVGAAAAPLVISGNVDLSIGGMYALSSVVTAKVMHDTQNPLLACVAALAVGLLLGIVNGWFVSLLSISPIIVTLGTASIFTGLAFVVTNGATIFGFPTSFTNFGASSVAGVPVQVWIALVFFVLVGLVLRHTVYGLRTYAIGGNREAAERNGVNADLHVTTLFALSGVAAALAGLLTTAQLGSGTANIGIDFQLDVLTAVILGGVAFNGGAGKPIGVFIGVATIGILNSGMLFVGLSQFYQDIAKGAVLLIALGADQVAIARRARRVGVDLVAAGEDAEPASVASVDPLSVREHRERPPRPVFTCAHLSKHFGAMWAVKDVSFDVGRGEIVCLVGDNGAGKSSLIKAITGVFQPDSGTMSLNGERYRARNPGQARAAGVATVYQDLALCANLGAAYNLALGAEPRRWKLGWLSPIDTNACMRLARERLARLGASIDDCFRPVGTLSGGQRQAVAIARVAADDVSLAILDEPTAALGVAQSRNVLALTRQLSNQGVAVVMISHDVDSILAVADRIVVLHLGQVICEGTAEDVSQSDLIHLMAGIMPEHMRSRGTDGEAAVTWQ